MNTLFDRALVADRPPLQRWLIAGVLFAIALAVRFWADPILPPGFPFLTFFPAVILATFICGLVPGAVVAVVAGLSSWYFFIAPTHSLALDGNSALAMGFYALIVIVDILIIHGMVVALRELRIEREKSARLAASRQTMFSELQHRISNNLQVVSALLRVQRAKIDHPDARRALDEAIGRLSLIANLHRRMHDPSGARLALDRFLREVCDEVVATSAIDQTIDCSVEAPAIPLDPEQALPLALLAGEFVSNAIEHGFGAGRDGVVTVHVRDHADGWLELEVADNGAGLPAHFSLDTIDSIGLRVSRQLAEQIGGRLEILRDEGTGRTLSRVRFPNRPAQ